MAAFRVSDVPSESENTVLNLEGLLVQKCVASVNVQCETALMFEWLQKLTALLVTSGANG